MIVTPGQGSTAQMPAYLGIQGLIANYATGQAGAVVVTARKRYAGFILNTGRFKGR